MDATCEQAEYGVKVKCSEQMIKGFDELVKYDDIPNGLKATLIKFTEDDEIPFTVLSEIQEYCKMKKGSYFHELMENSKIILPNYEPPPRNPELEARIQRLKNEQMNREYERMTRNVSFGRHCDQVTSFGQEIKSVQNMLITIFNFVLTVVGSFTFAYKAMEYSLTEPNIPMQLCSGLVVGTMVFFADLYFVMKHEMVEEGTVSISVYDRKMK